MRTGNSSCLSPLQLHVPPKGPHHKVHRVTIKPKDFQKVLMNTNKSIVYIKLPQQHSRLHNTLETTTTIGPAPTRSHQQRDYSTLMPPLNQKKPYSDYEEKQIRQTIRDKRQLLHGELLQQPRYSPEPPLQDPRVIVKGNQSLHAERKHSLDPKRE